MNLPILIRGRVVRGAGRGKGLGFPTANLDTPADGIEEGIYVGYTAASVARKQPSLVFIGPAKTFGENICRVETHILDYRGDLYGRELVVELLQKLRDNMKFASAGELVEQIKKDEAAARRFLKEAKSGYY